MTRRRTVLVVDDEPFVRESLVDVLDGEGGLRAVAAGDLREALALLERQPVDAIVADLQMPGGGARELLAELARAGRSTPVIVLTGVGTIDSAVAAMKAGAFEFVQKPVAPGQLRLLVERAVHHGRLLGDVRFLRAAVGGDDGPLVGDSPGLRRVRELVAQVAPTDSTVLITGESGTGKELVATAIHRQGPRAERHLVRVDCGALTEALFDSEIFGHRRGSFPGADQDRRGRFEEADGGTLVLDEVGTLRLDMQARLLRVLESGEYQVLGESQARTSDVRIVATSNENLVQRVEEGAFRRDLYYRLAIFPIVLPPLRERREDIAPLAFHLLGRLRGRGGAPRPLDPASVDVLTSHHWPGNVRELRNLLERALILAGSREPDAALFRSLLESSVQHAPEASGHALHLRSQLEACERETLSRALARSAGRRKDAAALLGIDPRNLAYYLRKHGLQDRDGKDGEG